jgi:tRNA pseudouridine55 synthase
MATGVLVVCLGRATRLIPYLEENTGAVAKEYEAEIRFGFETTTDDAEGTPVTETKAVDLSREVVARALERFVGDLDQVPPAFSARKIDGERAYDIARRGDEVVLKPSRIHVESARLLEVEGDRARAAFACSRGTYIRALARDLGRALGLGAHLTALRRTRSGEFTLGQATKLDELIPDLLASRLTPLASILGAWPAFGVDAALAARLRQGRSIPVQSHDDSETSRYRVRDEAGALVALVRGGGGVLSPFCVF